MHENSALLQQEFIKDPDSVAFHQDSAKMEDIMGKQRKYKLDRAEKHIRASISLFN